MAATGNEAVTLAQLKEFASTIPSGGGGGPDFIVTKMEKGSKLSIDLGNGRALNVQCAAVGLTICYKKWPGKTVSKVNFDVIEFLWAQSDTDIDEFDLSFTFNGSNLSHSLCAASLNGAIGGVQTGTTSMNISDDTVTVFAENPTKLSFFPLYLNMVVINSAS